MTTIETREIRGITAKLAYMILGTFAAGMITAFGIYGGIKSAIAEQNTTNQVQDVKIEDVRVRQAKIEMEIIQLRGAAHKNIINE